jgi:hypothetical protein
MLNDILAEVKRLLKEPADNNGHWSENELVRRINQAQRDFCMRTYCILKTAALTFDDINKAYLKPDNCLKIKTILYDGKRLKGTTQDEADALAGVGKLPIKWRELDGHNWGSSEYIQYYVQNFKNVLLCPNAYNPNKSLTCEYFSLADDMSQPAAGAFNGADFLQEYETALICRAVYLCMLEDQNEIYREYDKLYKEQTALYFAQNRQEDNLESFK